MTAKPWVVVAVMAMMCLMPYQSIDFGYLSDDAESKEGPGQGQGPADILLMGNSYVASNSLHNLIDGVMNAASQPANVSALSGGGMILPEHASNVASSGHQWNTTLNNGNWDWVILQDQSQVPGLPRSDSYWTNSKNGAVELAEVIEDNGGETVLMMTWGRRAGDGANPWHGYNQRFSNFSNMQDELASGYLDYRENITANGDTAWVAPVGLAFEHIHDKIVVEGGTPTDSGNTFYNLYTGDGSHPSLSGSYLAAVVIYATITGNDPVGLSHSTSLSNGLVLELQQAAAATVFNETSHLDYPWQTNSGGGNSGPSITIPANETLAFDNAISIGGQSYDLANDVIVAPSGNVYILGTSRADFTVQSCSYNHTRIFDSVHFPFIAKFDNNGTCLWLKYVAGTSTSAESGVIRSITYSDNAFEIDSNENVYFTTTYYMGSSPQWNNDNLKFGDQTINPPGHTSSILAKLNSSGGWQWAKSTTDHSGIGGGDCSISPTSLTVDNSDNVWFSTISGNDCDANIITKYSSSGTEIATSSAITSISPNEPTMYNEIYDLETDSSGNLYAVGRYKNNIMIDSQSLSAPTLSQSSGFILKLDSSASLEWINHLPSSTSNSKIKDIEISSQDKIIALGEFYSTITINTTTLDASGSQNGFLAMINQSGSWQWGKHLDCSCSIYNEGLIFDSSENIYVTGGVSTTTGFNLGNGVTAAAYGSGANIFVAKFDPNGDAQWAKTISQNGDIQGKSLAIDEQKNILYILGNLQDVSFNIGSNLISSSGADDIFLATMTKDYDADDIPDSSDIDDDGDFVNDPIDSCHFSPLGFRSSGSSDHDSDGCQDEVEDDDDDNDELNDSLDSCPKGMIDWLRTSSSDFDNDGCMDALEDYDDDNDGVDDYEDYCPRVSGNSTMEFEKGCPDTDGDGRPDILDPFKNDPTEWFDTDGDEVGDNSDAFPSDATQQYDTDGDTYGDEEFGNAGDSCPTVFGNSTIDRYGCLDSDGDGWSDEGDDFPNDSAEHLDSDSDGYPDSSDDFPFDPTQWKDSDGDGYGDNPAGNLADAYPNDVSRYADSDRDGIDDQADAFPYDPTQTEDRDGDGMGDNPMGIGADKFPDDVTQWGDIDGDGYGDNPNGTNPDAFPTDATQWSDADGDGYGDNPAGRLYDLFPDNPTQWIDDDEDGLGDNQSGTDADPYLNDFDNDGYNDTIDILPRLSSPGDLDADGCLDEDDAFNENPLECLDTDGDGVGDNGDADDDNDGWTDADEGRANTDPLDPNDTPVDSFEIVVPGTEIGLGAWDLIGMFGGIPIFSWILFGFITRNKRCARYEEQLEEAQSRDELEQVALNWEYSLMLRLLGPHQGIRLERIRSELDDKFENAENMMAAEDFEPMTEVDQTPIVESQQKVIPEIGSGPSISAVADQVDENGYSWIMHEGKQWYRTNSESHWFEFEN